MGEEGSKAGRCDDGNLNDGDGCDSTCAVECAWTCSGGDASKDDTCNTQCGDGLLAGLEECDDGNSQNGDGCSMTCKVEAGWACSSSTCSKSYCSSSCGDSIRVGDEECDDGNYWSYVGWIIQGVRRRESVFGGWLLSKLPGVTCVCHVRLSFSLSLSLSHSLTPSLFLRLNAAGSARGGEQTRLTRVLRRRAETARWEGARSVTMGIRWPSTVVTQLVRSSQGTHVCTTSRPTTHAGPTLRGARR